MIYDRYGMVTVYIACSVVLAVGAAAQVVLGVGLRPRGGFVAVMPPAGGAAGSAREA